MKKIYNAPAIEMSLFKAEDVITVSLHNIVVYPYNGETKVATIDFDDLKN